MGTAIVWFRQDLRLADNPALTAALADHKKVIPVYVHAPGADGAWAPGAASNWWLHHSLQSLAQDLHARGSRLVIRTGDTHLAALQALASETGATHVYWNRLYEPQHVERDKAIKAALQDAGVEVGSHNSALLFEPWAIAKKDGTPYRVFTPFWKACLKAGLPDPLHAAPGEMTAPRKTIGSTALDDLGLLPTLPWAERFPATWQPGEAGAHAQLEAFADGIVIDYSDHRDRPDILGTSMLSPHLHFGEISPRQVVQTLEHHSHSSAQAGLVSNTEAYVREIGWREFAYYLLFHFPHTTDRPLDQRFERFPWRDDYAADLEAWQRGQTGIPIVDAGMRQLWETGWMHNRVRMIVASFLVKNLLVPWQEGARWFWDTLVDADLASNTLGWQWTAGCGADAAPYFRIFNPVTQAQKFDPRGHYIRRWVPEISALPDKYLASPWSAPAEIIEASSVVPGRDYPEPIADLKTSRVEALARFNALKQAATTD